MMDEPLFVCVAFLLAGFTQGATGFGSGIVSMALLSSVMPLTDVVPIVAVFGSIVSVTILVPLWRNIDRQLAQSMSLLMFGQLFGVPLGVHLLKIVDPQWLRFMLGATMVIFATQKLYARYKGTPAADMLLSASGKVSAVCGLPVGFTAGVLGGSLNQGGPPVVAYFSLYKKWDKDRVKCSLQLFFAAMSLYSVAMHVNAGTMGQHHLYLDFIGIPATLLGIACGTRVYNKFDTQRFLLIIHVFLLTQGLVLIVGSMRSMPGLASWSLPHVAPSRRPCRRAEFIQWGVDSILLKCDKT